jgi:hypothetical protein
LLQPKKKEVKLIKQSNIFYIKTKLKKRETRLNTRTEMFGTSIDEVNKASTTIKLGEKIGSVGLRFRGFDPLKARSNGAAFAATFAEDSTTITT